MEVCVIVFQIQSTTGFAYGMHDQSIKSRERIEEWHFCEFVIDDVGNVGTIRETLAMLVENMMNHVLFFILCVERGGKVCN